MCIRDRCGQISHGKSRYCLKLTGREGCVGLRRENFGIPDIQKVETSILVILDPNSCEHSAQTHFWTLQYRKVSFLANGESLCPHLWCGLIMQHFLMSVPGPHEAWQLSCKKNAPGVFLRFFCWGRPRKKRKTTATQNGKKTVKTLYKNGKKTVKKRSGNIKNAKKRSTSLRTPRSTPQREFALTEQAEMRAKWVPDASRRLLDPKKTVNKRQQHV